MHSPTDELIERKNELRRRIKDALAALDPQVAHQLSLDACQRLAKAEFFERANTVLLYLPVPGELDITSLALRAFQMGKVVAAPRVDWGHKRMTPVEIRSFDDKFEVGKHGVRQPAAGRPIPGAELDLIIAPGLAFDATGARLGRGAGFYDRFLESLPPRRRATTCGLGFDLQIVDEIPAEPHDVRLELVVTDRRVIGAGSVRHA